MPQQRPAVGETNRANGPHARIDGISFEDRMMVFQPSYDATHDHDAHDDRLRSNQRSRLDRMFSRRAQKAATYRRVLVTTQSRFLGFGRQAV